MHGSSKAIAQHTTKYILGETTSKEAIKQICNVNKDLTLYLSTFWQQCP